MNDAIKIGSVSMPLSDFVVSRNAILGITKSGKTYTAKGVAEQLLEHDIPIIVFDAIGVWRYLKTPGDGSKAKGFKVVVAGGEHPDLPLTPKSAPEIVRAAIKENIPLIIDLYDAKLSKADWRRIVQACFRILLYENKGLRHVFLEESAEFAPQKVMDGETYAEVEKLARMGGNKGIGITFINQRAQELNKAVLELCDNVVLLRQRGSHAIDALEKWLDRLSPDTAKEIATSMPHMTQGDCWIFTETAETAVRTRSGLLKSIHPDRRSPEQALANRKPVDADVFVQKLSNELPKLVEEQKENDPALLKKRIAELERQLRSQKPTVETREVSIITDDDRRIIEKACSAFDSCREGFELVEQVGLLLRGLKIKTSTPQPTAQVRIIPRQIAAPVKLRAANVNGSISGGMRRMLVALAQRSPLTKKQIGVRSGLSSSSGTFGTYLGALRASGFVCGDGDNLDITQEGRTALGDYDPLPAGEDLLQYWLGELGQSGAGRMLSVLAQSYPQALTKSELGERAEISSSSGTFGTYLGKLRTLELIEGRGEIRASREFFE